MEGSELRDWSLTQSPPSQPHAALSQAVWHFPSPIHCVTGATESRHECDELKERNERRNCSCSFEQFQTHDFSTSPGTLRCIPRHVELVTKSWGIKILRDVVVPER